MSAIKVYHLKRKFDEKLELKSRYGTECPRFGKK